jgi:hypothetical protein
VALFVSKLERHPATFVHCLILLTSALLASPLKWAQIFSQVTARLPSAPDLSEQETSWCWQKEENLVQVRSFEMAGFFDKVG